MTRVNVEEFLEMDKVESRPGHFSVSASSIPGPVPSPKDLGCLEKLTNPLRMEMTSNQFPVWTPLVQVSRMPHRYRRGTLVRP